MSEIGAGALHQLVFQGRREERTPRFHYAVLEALRSDDRLVAIQAFRGAAKTSLGEETMLMELLEGRAGYGLIVGNSLDSAIERVETIKYEIETNEMIALRYGHQVGPMWRQGEIELANGAKLKAFGVGQQIRGKKEKHSRRPDFILCDDLEDEENARTDEARRKLMSWFLRALLPALHPKKGRLRVIGTPMGPDSLMVKLARHKGFRTLRFPILDASGESMWPERFATAEVENIRRLYVEAGDGDGFEQEYMLNPVGKENRVFQTEKVGRMSAALMPQGPVVSACDPARKAIGKVARTGHAVYSWVGDTLYVREAKGYYHKPSQTIDELFRLNRRWAPVEMGIEKDGLEDYLMEPLSVAMTEKGDVLPVVALAAPRDRDKTTFILGLQPFLEAGRIVVSEFCEDLVAEMEAFPRGRVDVLNALAYAVRTRKGKSLYNVVLRKTECPVIPSRDKWLVGESDGANTVWWVLAQIGPSRVEIVEAGKRLCRSLSDEWMGVVSEARRDYGGVKVWTTVQDERLSGGVSATMRRQGVLSYRTPEVPVGCMATALANGDVVVTGENGTLPVLHALNGGYRWDAEKDQLVEGDASRFGRLVEVVWSQWAQEKRGQQAPRHYQFGGR